ncbi:MAG TPA: condensation domain-containing protein, partial [Polyangia bacterium]|nr:condensation domain-containing protein [Polyangia bacterium]
PLSANGKLDRRALPAPGGEAFGVRGYEAPRGELEQRVASMWADLLRVERVGRDDNFFALGGHSLLAVTLVERMRRAGLHADVRTVFSNPSVAGLAQALAPEPAGAQVPPNLIPADAQAINPEMLTLVKLNQPEIDRLVATVPGGAANVQDIYPLAPLQEGILFHHLVGERGDAYLVSILLTVGSREQLDGFVATLQSVVDRHDILRTSIAWEGLDEPVQVVHRRATIPLEVLDLDPQVGPIADQLKGRYEARHYRMDLDQAPLLRTVAACDAPGGRWLLLVLAHHLVIDHATLRLLVEEAEAIEAGQGDRLSAPVPFRNFVARARGGKRREEHEAFFREMLGEVEEPTAPFELLEVEGNGSGVDEFRRLLPAELSAGVRAGARAAGVSTASVMHLAWALVLSRLTGQSRVVFGTVLFGRMGGGAEVERVLGMFINTLPVRIDVAEPTVTESLQATQGMLARIIEHEHASLALAQRCSGVPAQTPLFTALLNYRHTALEEGAQQPEPEVASGPEVVWSEERTNYPVVLSVDDLGRELLLTAQVSAPASAQQVCALMETALA